jgi:dihydrofolate reductase
MGNILVHEFISLDGVIEDPRWTAAYPFDPKMGEDIGAFVATCEALLLGRTTYEMFAQAWPHRTVEEDPGAPFFNDSTKYVVSGNLENPQWQNTTVIGPYSAESVRALKDRVERNLYVSGSGQLTRAMLADGLVDELHLFVYPVALGAGTKLFTDGHEVKLALASSDTYDNGVVHLAYRPAA